MLANYNNRTYSFCHEAIEIMNNRETCNETKYFSIDPKWQQIVNKKSNARRKRRENRIKERKTTARDINSTEEGVGMCTERSIDELQQGMFEISY